MPALDARLAGLHHLLVLDDAVSPSDVAALARSRFPEAGFSGTDLLVLFGQVHLTGPWELDDALRRTLDLPAWAQQAWLCFVQQDRSGPLPIGLIGTDPILDAYPHGVPDGDELDTLHFLQSVARRLGGGVHLAGTTTFLAPDPQSAIDLVVYTGASVPSEAVVAGLGRDDVRVDGTDDTWALTMPPVEDDDDGGVLHVTHEPSPVPFAISGMPWAEHATAVAVRWYAPWEKEPARLSRRERGVRDRAIHAVETVARTVLRVGGGVVLDDDGFVVAL